jgi:pectin methylesterase-like acyl-CoA thioesterase
MRGLSSLEISVRRFAIFLTLGCGLQGCQSPPPAQISAEATCANAGFNLGTARYYNCASTVARQNRAVVTAVAVGVAAAVADRSTVAR